MVDVAYLKHTLPIDEHMHRIGLPIPHCIICSASINQVLAAATSISFLHDIAYHHNCTETKTNFVRVCGGRTCLSVEHIAPFVFPKAFVALYVY